VTSLGELASLRRCRAIWALRLSTSSAREAEVKSFAQRVHVKASVAQVTKHTSCRRSGWSTNAGCGHQISVIVGTIFEQSKKPLASWFRAIFEVTASKQGISAAELHRKRGVGSYSRAIPPPSPSRRIERVGRRCPYSSIGPPTMCFSRSLPTAPSLKPSTSANTSSVCSPSTGARRGVSRGTDENSSGEPGTR
jgi:hypothetical protein